MKTHIEDNDLEQSQVLLSVHDQQVSEVRRLRTVGNHTELEKAAMYVIPSETLKAESDIMDHWTKG
jgi:hypothetical protein